MSGVTADSLVHDLQIHMKQYGPTILRTHRLAVGQVCSIVAFCLCILGADAATISKPILRSQILSYVSGLVAEADDVESIDLLVGPAVHISLLPDVLDKFVGAIGFTNHHLQPIWRL